MMNLYKKWTKTFTHPQNAGDEPKPLTACAVQPQRSRVARANRLDDERPDRVPVWYRMF